MFARFIDASAEEEEPPSEEEETPSEEAADTPVGTPEMASGDTADATDDTDTTDGEAAEQAADGEAAELDDPAKASLSEGGGAEAPEGVVPFDQSVNYNGVVITVKADAGTFPASATLSVMRVLLYEQTQADAAVDEVRDEDQNVAARYTFDISILDEDGNELQPAEGHSVEVNFALAEAGDENLETNVYHITEDMAAEKLDTEATDEAVTAVTDGFSLYTVEFTYEKREYILPGDSSVALSEILDAVGLKGAAEAVSVSAPELFSVETNAAGAWIVRANRAFTSTEWMRVTIGGIEYEITVTDDALYAININPYISDGSIVSIEVGDNSYTGDSLQNNSITAAENDTVTVTVKPAQDYYTENLSVSNSNITVNKDESNPNVFSFTMINASVTVGANFHLLSERVKATAVPSDGGTAMINPTGDDLFSIYNVSQGNPVDVRVKSNDGYSIRDVKYTY